MAQALNILMIITQYAPIIGGAERQAQAVSEALVERGHNVTVLTQALKDHAPEEMVNGVRVLRRLQGVPLGLLWGLSYMHRADRELKRLAPQFDVIHCHQFYFYTAIAARLRKRHGTPVVCKAVNTGLRSDIKRLATRTGGSLLLRWARNCDRVIATTRAVEREVLHYHFRPEQIERIPNFVDLSQYNCQSVRGGDEWLYLGRLDQAKGPDLLIKAMHRARGAAKAMRLVIAGDGSMAADLKSRVQALGLSDRIRFHGPTHSPAELLSCARGVILPSRSEGLSNVLLEALACGKPVIATDVGGTREVLEDNQPVSDKSFATAGLAWTPHGILVRPFDEESLAAALEQAETSYDRLQQCGVAASAMIRRNYAKEQVLDKIEALYMKLAG